MRTGRGFEWFVAWRHLRDTGRRPRWVLNVGLITMALALIALGVAWYMSRTGPVALGPFRPRPLVIVERLRIAGIVALSFGSLVSFVGFLRTQFTLFTALSITGVFWGTSAPIVALSVMSGFEADLKGKIRGAKADVVITMTDDKPFTDWQAARAKIADVRGLAGSTPYIESEVMLRSGGTGAGVILRGIDPATAPAVLDLARTLREGKVDDLAHPERVPSTYSFSLDRLDPKRKSIDELEAKEDELPPPPRPKTKARPVAAEEPAAEEPVLPTIILGEELYGKNLRVFLGTEMEVVCPLCGVGPTGARPKSRAFRVAGHFYSGMYEFDSKLAYVSLEEAQRFLEMPGEITGIDVRTTSPEHAGEVAGAIQKRLGPRFEVRSWEELNRGLFMALRLEKIAMFIVLTFIALVASFSIVATLIMMVTEKAREVAILKGMGATDGAIMRVFFAQGLYIGLLGLATGVASGISTCMAIKDYGLPLPTDVYYINQLPIVMRAGEIMTVAGLALLLCCLATVYPALRASRLKPVEGLRYE